MTAGIVSVMSPLILLLNILCLLLPFVTTQGSVALFLDAICQNPSKINPSYNIHLDICLVTSGVFGVVAETLPKCDSRAAILDLYRDTSCATSMPRSNDSGCLSNSPTYDIPAVMFTCQAATGQPTVRDTLTVSASSSSSNTGVASTIDLSSVTATLTAVMTNPTLSPAYPSTKNPTFSDLNASTPVASAFINPFPTSTSDTGGDRSSGISQSDRIALGVGLSVPIAAILIAVLIWQCPKKTGG